MEKLIFRKESSNFFHGITLWFYQQLTKLTELNEYQCRMGCQQSDSGFKLNWRIKMSRFLFILTTWAPTRIQCKDSLVWLSKSWTPTLTRPPIHNHAFWQTSVLERSFCPSKAIKNTATTHMEKKPKTTPTPILNAFRFTALGKGFDSTKYLICSGIIVIFTACTHH